MIWCKQNYGHYALFATLCLHTAVIRHDRYGISSFGWAFRHSGKDHKNDTGLRDFMENLAYVDSHIFTTDELRFISNQLDLTDFIRTNRSKMNERRSNELDIILDSHADCLLKAIEYWRLHFNDKYQTWRHEFSDAVKDWILRRKLADGITQDEGVIVADEGIYSEKENSEDGSDVEE